MSRKKTQPSKAETAKEMLDTLATGKPTEHADVPPPEASEPKPGHEMTSEQTGVEQQPAQRPELPKQDTSEQQAIAPVSNAFDTAPNKERLHELEDKFRQKMAVAYQKATEAIEVILTIRDERQYLADGYETFDDYMEDRWNHTRQWVEQMEKHLKMVRIMEERLGVTPDEARKKLTVYDATILRPLQDDPDVLVAAIKEAEDQYKATGKKSPKTLKQVVEKWDGFRRLSEKIQPDEHETPTGEKPHPLTPEEFGLLAQLKRDKHNMRQLGLVDQAKEKSKAERIPLVVALDNVCEEANSVPPDEELLKEARGEALKELIAPLAARVRLWKADDKLKETEALKEAARAKAELDKLQKEMAKTPEQKEQERLQQEGERRKQEEREAEREKHRQEAHDRWQEHQKIWAWHEDDLSWDGDPRKWCEQENHEGYNSDTLVQIAADCLADAVKRLPEMDEADQPTAIKAAEKAIKWAKELLANLPAQEPPGTTNGDSYFPDEEAEA